MTKNSTLLLKCFLLTITTLFFLLTARADHGQNPAPKLKFRQPQLVSGINGAVGATYKFASVTTGVDAFITIEDINNGAILVNIDDSTIGYYDAWQPTVGGPNVAGTSYIKWSIEFKKTDGNNIQVSYS